MATLQRANINTEILKWAMDRARIDIAGLAKKLGTKSERVKLWEEGEALPTVNQAMKISNVLRIPYGFFYLPEPPQEKFPLPDLRTVGSVDSGPISLDLIDIVKEALQRQKWYEEYLLENGIEECNFVGRFTINDSVEEVVADIRNTLNVGLPTTGNWENYHSSLINAIEAAGVLVMRSGIAAGNTSRKLNVKEFRGFAITSRLAPLIFINSADAPTARLFTLLHELAHIWIDSSGISNITCEYTHPEEIFCNQVAGNFLVPEQLFHQRWNFNDAPASNFAKLASYFYVSKLVIAKRALDYNVITEEDYQEFYETELNAFRESKGGGGDYYRTVKAKNSAKFSEAVISEALRGSLLLRDAGRLLGITPNKIKRFAKELER